MYQIYGHHTVYGPGTLIYLGKAEEQTFGRRLGQHGWLKDFEMAEGAVGVHVGRLAGSEKLNESVWKNQISRAESLLIYSHSPAINSREVADLSAEVDKSISNILVLNWGERGKLLPEVSGARWSSMFDDPPSYKIYGT